MIHHSELPSHLSHTQFTSTLLHSPSAAIVTIIQSKSCNYILYVTKDSYYYILCSEFGIWSKLNKNFLVLINCLFSYLYILIVFTLLSLNIFLFIFLNYNCSSNLSFLINNIRMDSHIHNASPEHTVCLQVNEKSCNHPHTHKSHN